MAFRYNLLILYTPGLQSVDDWKTIHSHIGNRAPDIEVRITRNKQPHPAAASWQVSRPSLVFSPRPLVAYRPQGGTVRAGVNMGKLAQRERLRRIGIPTPETFILSPDFSPDPSLFGEFAVVKPGRLGQGRGVRLVRTHDLKARYGELTEDGQRRLLVQPYLEHAEEGYPTEFRVLTMFGRVLYCARNRWGEKRRPLDEIADTDGLIASNNKTMGGRVRVAWMDEEIIALAERASSAFPECGVLGVDVIREPSTGTLYVLEVNPRGGVWHFSSGLARKTFTPEHVHELYHQFNALERAADLLIDKTRAAAS
jgi:hypothetical protein